MKGALFYVVFLLMPTITTRCVLISPVCDDLKLSTSEVSVEEQDKTAFEIVSGSGDYSITVANTEVVAATFSGTTVIVKGVKEGKSSVTVFDKNTNQRVVVDVNVTKLIPRMTFTTTGSIGEVFKLGLFGSEFGWGKNPGDAWIDINNNGIKEKGEDLSEIEMEYEHNMTYVLVDYPRTHIYAFKLLSQTVTVYGDVTHLDFLNLSESTAPYYEEKGAGFSMVSNSRYKKNPTKLTSLEVRKNKGLRTLRCGLTGISTLDVTEMTLRLLDCSKNNLKSLDVSASAVGVLRCADNQLTSLKLGDISKLNCANNQLTTLDFKGNSIKFIDCSENKIDAEAMANMVNSLPLGGIAYEDVGLNGIPYPVQTAIVTNSNSPTEKNKITSESIIALKKKKWKVGWTDYNDNNKFKEY